MSDRLNSGWVGRWGFEVRRLIWLSVFVFLSAAAAAQTGAVQDYCNLGATKATVSGMKAANYQQGIAAPSCLVKVYLHGTTNLATITTDGSTALSNPFTANTDGSWLFFAAYNVGYDVTMSGGVCPSCFVTPKTLVDIFPTQSLTPVTGVFSVTAGQGLTASPTTGDVIVSCDTATSGQLGCSKPDGVSITALAGVYSAVTQISVNGSQISTPNFNSASPSPDSGYIALPYKASASNVITEAPIASGSAPGLVQVDNTTTTITNGIISASLGGSLAMQSLPPAGGTFIKVYPSSYILTPGSGYFGGSLATKTGARLLSTGCTLGGCSNYDINVVWSFTLPSYVNPANVTAVWASGNFANSPLGNGTGHESDALFHCDSGINSYSLAPNGQATSYGVYYYGAQQNAHMTAATGSSVNSITCTFDFSSSSVVQAGMTASVTSIYLQLADTVDTAPTDNTIRVAPPLQFNSATQTLNLNMPPDLELDTGAANAYAATDGNMSTTPGQTVRFVPAHNSTSAAPTFSLNGTAGTILGPTGLPLASGDMLTTVTAILVYQNGTGNWNLQNPQKSFPTAGAGPAQSVISSATTIAPTTRFFHVNGTTTISTITAPGFCVVSGTMCQITMIPDALWVTTTGGNIAIATTAVVSKALIMTYDPGTTTWYPSY